MPALHLEDVPPDVYDCLQQLATAHEQPIAVEAVQQLRKLLPSEPFLTEEIPAPCTLPLPGKGVRVTARPGGKLLPPPFELPEDQQ